MCVVGVFMVSSFVKVVVVLFCEMGWVGRC